jgi:predicted SnoaL-like aldol condensation-catalyzing enzyme
MKTLKAILIATSFTVIFSASAFAQTNKEIVVAGMKGLFITRDATVIDQYWSPDYVQHNPSMPNGTEVLKGWIGSIGPEFKYEPGMVIADGDLVMAHGRYSGMGPKPMIAVDIFRLASGKIVEHWDILQEETLKTVSGNPMFPPPKSNGIQRRQRVRRSTP